MSITRSITRPITRPLSRPLTAGGVGGLPAATHYVSQSATNGYAVGVDSGAGTTKAAPWLTLEYAIANAPSGSVIYVNDGSYAAATFYSIGKSLTFVSENPLLAVMKSAAAQQYIATITASFDIAVKFYGFTFDAESSTQRNVRFGSSSLTSTISVEFYSCAFNNATVQPILSNSHKNLNLRIRNCTVSGTFSGTDAVRIPLHENGALDIDGLTFNSVVMTSASNKSVIRIDSATGGTNCRIARVSGTVSTAQGSSLNGVNLYNFDNALIENCSLTLNNAVAGGALYRIYCDSGTRTANNGIIRNNTGFANINGGYCIIYGQDGTTAGNGRQNNGSIYGNVVTANPTSATPIHGLMLGYGIGGEVYNNTVTGAGLAMIAKNQEGGEFYGNTVNECNSQCIRGKGTTDTVFRDNTINLSASFAGDCVVIDANDAPVEDSTGIEITDNVFNIAAAPTNIVRVDVGSDAAFSGNTYNITTALGADSWKYQGTAYQTLEAWKAAVEPTALP